MLEMILSVSHYHPFSLFRKMQISGAADLASKSQGFSDSTTVKPKEEIVDSYHMEKIRCVCGSSLPTDSMIKVCRVCLLMNDIYKALYSVHPFIEGLLHCFSGLG